MPQDFGTVWSATYHRIRQNITLLRKDRNYLRRYVPFEGDNGSVRSDGGQVPVQNTQVSQKNIPDATEDIKYRLGPVKMYDNKSQDEP